MSKVVETTCFTDAEKRLFKAVMRQIGDWESVYGNPEDYRDASCGILGFTYYADTVKFAKNHMTDILIVLNAFEQDVGPLKTKPKDADETDELFNWYAWFALEHCIHKVMDFKEGCYA